MRVLSLILGILVVSARADDIRPKAGLIGLTFRDRKPASEITGVAGTVKKDNEEIPFGIVQVHSVDQSQIFLLGEFGRLDMGGLGRQLMPLPYSGAYFRLGLGFEL